MTKSSIDAHLGLRLQRLRDQRRMSMSEIGRGIGMTYQQVKKYEAGENRISASTLYRIALLLDVEVADFFEGLPLRNDRDDRGPAPAQGGVASALERVEDPEIRRHLKGLLQALGSER